MLYSKINEHFFEVTEAEIIAEATEIYNKHLKRGESITSPKEAADFIWLKIIPNESEVFLGLFLDSQYRIICCEELFRGTIDQATIHIREVIKKTLFNNAKAVIFAHNHPSGSLEPSRADIEITRKLENALEIIEVKLLDHLICGNGVYSLKEKLRI